MSPPAPRTFDVRIEPPLVRMAIKCDACKLTNSATARSKASYSHGDVLDLLVILAQLTAKPCGCAS